MRTAGSLWVDHRYPARFGRVAEFGCAGSPSPAMTSSHTIRVTVTTPNRSRSNPKGARRGETNQRAGVDCYESFRHASRTSTSLATLSRVPRTTAMPSRDAASMNSAIGSPENRAA